MSNVAPIRTGLGRNWTASRTECRIFGLTAVFVHDHWTYTDNPLAAPLNCAASLRSVVREAGKDAWYVYVTSTIGLRLLSDPKFDLVGMLLGAETRETETLIEARLPRSLRPARWIRIIPDWQPTLPSIWATTRRGKDLAQFYFRPTGD